MSMTEDQIDAIDKSVVQLQADKRPLIAGLRELFPGVVFVRCPAEDVREGQPFRSGEHHRLYLLDRSEMCIRFTDQLETADGVVIAELD